MFSSFNFVAPGDQHSDLAAGDTATGRSRGLQRCPLPYSAYFDALKDVGWFRFYEFFSPSVLPTFLAETAAGLPVVVHVPGNLKDNLGLAAFLIGQGDYSYFGTSNGWTDGGWTWHEEYDRTYGAPLGPAVKNSSGYFRELSGATVWMNAVGTQANITMKL
eukprot:SAG31_NODE_3673_length_3999_cov_2.498974_3_plen_161_part_00